MTTTVTVKPHGHNVEVIVTESGVETKSIPDPHSETHYAIYDTKTITIRETEG